MKLKIAKNDNSYETMLVVHIDCQRSLSFVIVPNELKSRNGFSVYLIICFPINCSNVLVKVKKKLKI